jgi:hypothetical protein
VTAEGRLYSLPAGKPLSGVVERPSFSPSAGGAVIFADAPVSADGHSMVWTEQAGTAAYRYALGASEKPVRIQLPAAAVAPAQASGSYLVAPLADGSIAMVAGEPDASKIAPFLPPLAPDALPQWKRPAVLADGKSIVISDGRGVVYALGVKDKPQAQLARLGESQTSGPVVSPLVVAGSAVVGVMRLEDHDALVGFDSRGAEIFEPIAWEGRIETGPFAVGGLVFVAGEEQLVCVESNGKIRWRQPLVHGPLAGPLLGTANGNLIAAFQAGIVARLDAATGAVLTQHDVGEPLAGPAAIVGEDIFLAGSDGVVHRAALPPNRSK